MRAVVIAGMFGLAATGLAAQNPPSTGETAPSANMSVEAFLGRIGELSRGGPRWTQTPEAQALFEAISGVGKAYRQDLAKRVAAGQPVEACLPPEAEVDSDQLFAHFNSYPAETARKTSIRDAFSELVRKSFPCR